MFEQGLTVIALIAVLMIPGPSNALLASSVQHKGFWASLKLIPTELLGYLYAIALWWLLIEFTQDIWPAFITILHIAGIIYVFWLAFNLWKMKQLQAYSQKFHHIKPSQLFYATLKNPKALLCSAGIFPFNTWGSIEQYLINMMEFSIVLVPCALFWLFFGGRLLSGKFKGIDQEQLFKGSALFLILCMLPIIIRFFVQPQ